MGRPREFDVEKALDRALQVFWRNGYDGASVADLTQAMGINPPSLYAAFGNKEGLFRQALDRYVEQRTKFWDEALAEPTARRMIERLLRGSADFFGDESNPPGCLFVRSTMLCGEAEEAIRRDLAARRTAAETRVRERLAAAQADGELPPDLDPTDYSRYILTVLEGMSVRAAGGATHEQLHKIADMALRTWPG